MQFYNYTILHYSQTSNLGFEKNQKGNSFITIRFYITLKLLSPFYACPCSFITIRFYITLKLPEKCRGRSRGFITIRFYITLKLLGVRSMPNLRFITIRFYITLKPQAHDERLRGKFYNYTILHYSQTSNLKSKNRYLTIPRIVIPILYNTTTVRINHNFICNFQLIIPLKTKQINPFIHGCSFNLSPFLLTKILHHIHKY